MGCICLKKKELQSFKTLKNTRAKAQRYVQEDTTVQIKRFKCVKCYGSSDGI
jgi:hypothetical protein